MKTNWQIKKLGEICEIEIGKTPSRGNKKLWDLEKRTNNTWVSIADMLHTQNKIILDSKEYISDEGSKLCKVVKEGTLLVSFKLTLGRLAFAGKHLYTNEAIAALSIKDEKEVSRSYLYYFLKFFDWDEATNGDIKVKGKTLNKAKLKEIQIIFPESFSEQQSIVKVLDKAFEKIEKTKNNTEENIENAKKLFESYLSSILLQPKNNWNKKTLKQVSNIFGRGKSKHRPRNDKKLYDGKYPFIQTGDVRNSKHLIDTYSQTYNDFGLAQSKLWPKGTVCITIAANIAETGILGFDACFPDSVIGVVPNPNETTSDFIEYLLQSYKAIIKSKGKGSAQPNINLATFENELFPFPSIKEQKEIVEKLNKLSEKVEGLNKNYQQKIAVLDELKKSILNKAFSGEL